MMTGELADLQLFIVCVYVRVCVIMGRDSSFGIATC